VLSRNAGQTERAETAEKLADELAGRIPKLEISALSAPDGLTVTRDGTSLGAGALGTKMAVDPGKHTIVATAPGYREWSTTVDVVLGEERTVAIPPLVKSSSGSDEGGSQGGMRTAGLVIGGVGVAAIGVGAVFGGLALSDASRARSDSTLCPDDLCTTTGREVVNGAETKATLSNVGLIVGGVALAAGTTLFVLTLGSSEKPRAARVQLGIVPTLGGIIVKGIY
jgi:hypothetical protein